MIYKIPYPKAIVVGVELIVATSVKICFINGKKVFDFVRYHKAKVEKAAEEIIPGSNQFVVKIEGIPIPVNINFLAIEARDYYDFMHVLSKNSKQSNI